MTWKPKIIIAGVVIVTAMVLNAFGINTFTQSVGLLAAGYIFGTVEKSKK